MAVIIIFIFIHNKIFLPNVFINTEIIEVNPVHVRIFKAQIMKALLSYKDGFFKRQYFNSYKTVRQYTKQP